MAVAVIGVSAALVAVVLHGIIVRWLPRRIRMNVLAGCCLVGAAFVGIVTAALGVALTPLQFVLSFILAASLVADYAIVFTGIEGDSPTLSIVNEILNHGAEGLPVGAIDAFVRRRPFVQNRIDALLESGLLVEEGDFFAARGSIGRLVEVAEFYRRLCGYQEKTG